MIADSSRVPPPAEEPPIDESRLIVLAGVGAYRRHYWYFDPTENLDDMPPAGHSQPFDRCQHPDCALVRIAGSRRPVLQEPPVWHPIETAPKDGTPILGWNGRHRRVMRWRSVNDNEFFDVPGIQLRHLKAEPPTHWMPLSDPPVVLPAPSDSATHAPSSVPADAEWIRKQFLPAPSDAKETT